MSSQSCSTPFLMLPGGIAMRCFDRLTTYGASVSQNRPELLVCKYMLHSLTLLLEPFA